MIFIVTTQVRYAHTDIKIPDFSAYRRESVKNPNATSADSEETRKSFSYLLVGGNLPNFFKMQCVIICTYH